MNSLSKCQGISFQKSYFVSEFHRKQVASAINYSTPFPIDAISGLFHEPIAVIEVKECCPSRLNKPVLTAGTDTKRYIEFSRIGRTSQASNSNSNTHSVHGTVLCQ